MATTSDNKYRINALAKDLNVKSKDIFELNDIEYEKDETFSKSIRI